MPAERLKSAAFSTGIDCCVCCDIMNSRKDWSGLFACGHPGLFREFEVHLGHLCRFASSWLQTDDCWCVKHADTLKQMLLPTFRVNFLIFLFDTTSVQLSWHRHLFSYGPHWIVWSLQSHNVSLLQQFAADQSLHCPPPPPQLRYLVSLPH